MKQLDENITVVSIKDYNLITGQSIKKYMDKKRYIVINKNNNEIIDNAQGYGFKNAHGAYKFIYYKQNYKDIQTEKKKVQKWWDEHKDVRALWENVLWYTTEDNIKVTEDDFKDTLQECNVDITSLPCKIKYLMKYIN